MGFTHYWTTKNKLSVEDWDKWTKMVNAILSDSSVAPLVCREYDRMDEPPEVSLECVAFNGKGLTAGHETFYITPKDTGFSFCKTARKPYDTAVTACLIALAAITSYNVELSSDGRVEEWAPGLALVHKVIPELRYIDTNMLKRILVH